uniref:Secreted protein n=1 Tax=Panstrongylus lignarius TaxID=156445 RepID=A0A224XSZ2_9HEMI
MPCCRTRRRSLLLLLRLMWLLLLLANCRRCWTRWSMLRCLLRFWNLRLQIYNTVYRCMHRFAFCIAHCLLFTRILGIT